MTKSPDATMALEMRSDAKTTPHEKEKNMGGRGKNGIGESHEKKGRQETKTMDIQEQPEDPEVNGDGWRAPVDMDKHVKKNNSGMN